MAGVVTLTSGAMIGSTAPQSGAPKHAAGGAPSRHRHGVPGDQPGAHHDRGAEPPSGRRSSSYNRLRGLYIAAQQFLQSLNFDVTPTAGCRQLSARPRSRWSRSPAPCCAPGPAHHLRRADGHTPRPKRELLLQPGARLRRSAASPIVFISHALEEALLLADRITVLRDGEHVVTDDAAKFDRDRIIAGHGRQRPRSQHALRHAQGREVRPAGEKVLSVQNL